MKTSHSHFPLENLFSDGLHICHIYNNDEERNKTMAEFFKRGISERNKILCIVDTVALHDIQNEIKNLGVTTDDLKNYFVTIDNDSAYNPTGNFDPDAVLKNIGSISLQARHDGFSGLHVSGDMAWILRDKISTDLLMEYETKVIDYQKLTPCTAVCEYDARKFDGSIIMDILSVHPVLLVRGQVVKNPYFIPPKEFLTRYYARRNN